MAVTGTGTQADPFVVHSYSEFISLSKHAPITGTEAVYIKWFDEPNQVLDCNTYGTEFRWDEFTTESPTSSGNNTFYIDLNGATIKNFLIASGKTMFNPKGYSNGYTCKMEVYNGAIRNVFMGSATSKVCCDYVTFHDVSMSVNVVGTTATIFNGNSNATMDNCALNLTASTLQAPLMTKFSVSDTDIKVYVSNVNQQIIFAQCTLTDCRLQGKISGTIKYYANRNVILGNTSASGSTAPLMCSMINCVVDVDFEGIRVSNENYKAVAILYEVATGELNTNIFCNTHLPSDQEYIYPDNWHYISHPLMRNGAYLNSKGFTVVQIVEG